MSDEMKQVGHGLRAGYEPGGNLAIECLWPDESTPMPRGVRVVVQRADIPDLLAVIAPALSAEAERGRAHVCRDRQSDCAGLASPAAIEAAGCPPTRAGAVHDALLSSAAIAAGVDPARVPVASGAAINEYRFHAPTPTADPTALLRAAIAKAATRAQPYDFAGLLTLAQALEAVNRAAPTGADEMIARVVAVAGTTYGTVDEMRECLTRALRGEDPSDG